MFEKRSYLAMVLALCLALFTLGCEDESDTASADGTGSTTGDATSSGDGVASDSLPSGDATTDTGDVTPSKSYRYVLVQDGCRLTQEEKDFYQIDCIKGPFDGQTTTCNGTNPGTDIDAIALFRDSNLTATCQSVTHLTGDSIGRVNCDGKNPGAEQNAAAVGPPDDCPLDHNDANSDGCLLDSDNYFWLNGGELVCDLGADMMLNDTLIVYEVFNNRNATTTADTQEEYTVRVSDSENGPWELIGTAVGIAPIDLAGEPFE